MDHHYFTLANKVGFPATFQVAVREAARREVEKQQDGDRSITRMALVIAAGNSQGRLRDDMISLYRRYCREDGIEPIPLI